MSRIHLSTAVVMALHAVASLPAAMRRIVMPSVGRGFQGEITLAPMTFGHRGAGISMAQQKRASRKTKNVKRHRAACRG